MSGRIALDTNIVIALFASNKIVQRKISDYSEVFTPSIVLGELFYGAYKSIKVHQNVTRLQEFAKQTIVLKTDKDTGEHYGRIKNTLRAKGKPIPENDIWIAALCRQFELTLLTQDNHFIEVENISVEIL
ncbi:MAG: type II toxin-antitoxin system VapC family toxin [Ignavibacteriae bacterium]|nr:type II toxin-antitoxin system VapC family toxin [Ignavibacteriota bacterium]